jgi:type III secretory pathway lipoprotein EscJ
MYRFINAHAQYNSDIVKTAQPSTAALFISTRLQADNRRNVFDLTGLIRSSVLRRKISF